MFPKPGRSGLSLHSPSLPIRALDGLQQAARQVFPNKPVGKGKELPQACART